MELPCGLCLGTCGGSFKRAPMDSNDSGRAHFFGQCLDPRPLSEKALQVQQFLTAVRRALPHEAALRRELTSWSSDASWNAEPRGPHALQVVLDALAEQGLVVSPRVLAHAVFDREDAGD